MSISDIRSEVRAARSRWVDACSSHASFTTRTMYLNNYMFWLGQLAWATKQ